MKITIYKRKSARTFFGRSQMFFVVNFDNYLEGKGATDPFFYYHLSVVGVPVIRYAKNHIGLGTKRFVDNLGGC